MALAPDAYVAEIPSPAIIPVIVPEKTGFAIAYNLDAGFGVTTSAALLTCKFTVAIWGPIICGISRREYD